MSRKIKLYFISFIPLVVLASIIFFFLSFYSFRSYENVHLLENTLTNKITRTIVYERFKLIKNDLCMIKGIFKNRNSSQKVLQEDLEKYLGYLSIQRAGYQSIKIFSFDKKINLQSGYQLPVYYRPIELNSYEEKSFEEIKKLKNNQVYWSPIILLKNNRVVMLVGTKVYDRKRHNDFYLIIEYKLNELIAEIKKNENLDGNYKLLISDHESMIVNSDITPDSRQNISKVSDETIKRLFNTTWSGYRRFNAHMVDGNGYSNDSFCPDDVVSHFKLVVLRVSPIGKLFPSEFMYFISIFIFFITCIALISYWRMLLKFKTENYNKQLEKMAKSDSLTHVLNRRELLHQAEIEFERSCRYGQLCSIVMIDIDNFKKINDTFGHLAGDSVLSKFVNTCQNEIRKTDILGRYGGDEFIILLPGTDMEEAENLASRILESISKERVQSSKGEVHFTVSVGISAWKSTDLNFSSTLQRVDALLYQAKEEGRNRVVKDSDS